MNGSSLNGERLPMLAGLLAAASGGALVWHASAGVMQLVGAGLLIAGIVVCGAALFGQGGRSAAAPSAPGPLPSE
ncbi:MAG: hypothetical protein HRF43_07195, partial [Phycisphaerae bacterium]